MPSIKEIDYGEPNINDRFLDSQNVHEISAQRLLYSTLLTPEIEEFVSKNLDNKIVRSRDERARIQETNTASELIEILCNNPDNINHEILKSKILAIQNQTIPLIFEKLKQQMNSVFYELAVKIIKATNRRLTNEVIDIIENYQRNAYAVSLLTILLGFYNEKQKSNRLLWNLYHYFKEHYPDETYSDGPLIALLEQRALDRELTQKKLTQAN